MKNSWAKAFFNRNPPQSGLNRIWHKLNPYPFLIWLLITINSLIFLPCRNLSRYLYFLVALPSPKLIPSKTSASTVFSLTLNLTRKESPNKNKSTNSSMMSGPKSWCVIKMINSAGNNIFLNYLASSVTPNAGSKNIRNFLAISMTFNAGGNCFQASPVISKTLIAGKNLMFTPEKHMKEEPKKFRIPGNSLRKGEEGLETSSRKQKNLQEKKPKRQKNIPKKLLNRRKKKPRKPPRKPVKLLGQLFLSPNHLWGKKLKLSKRKSSMVRSTSKISWLMLKIWLKIKLLTLKIMLLKKHKMPRITLKTKLTKWKDTSKEGLKTLKTLWKKKLNKLKKNLNRQQEMWVKDQKTSSSMLLKSWDRNLMKLKNF